MAAQRRDERRREGAKKGKKNGEKGGAKARKLRGESPGLKISLDLQRTFRKKKPFQEARP
jgi:hypothetical protein